ncbi:ATP-binding cassette domain-containing protein [Prosthecochloris sp. N3]|uniref:ATP-binding cassette domain-containing protein n=1 Tax=Prosthecochloris ethylica TaxID=2743976 RepID=A0ABR9XVI2_9CHLB|nr:ATP-binding cassette domain-containing protein [Prosthecochloris ethylica]MBF0587126.1 ATP-binding cassette domain-containing protein [Prosthecochloris ethylica]MBF0637646.1 ATP-binding cassette domain-containing protein [Prosthecochloris ethylica]NUK48068.1 ATP-binding cassette domain-containing protein [Prosthecochloris ethylica]
MLQPALVVDGVTAGYGGRSVLDGISLRVDKGEFVVLIGPNGCGKSTLLKTVAALLKPQSGRIELFGHDVTKLRPSSRAALLGVVPQKVESPMAYTVAQIVMNGRSGSSAPWKVLGEADYEIIERSMIYTDVLHLRDRYFMELSGGEQQRVILAMVLAQEPGMIMLDESISHLDINHRYEVLRILRRLNREHGMTVVLVSHDLSLSSEIADRLILMNSGSVVAAGSPADVLQVPVLSRVYDCDLQVQQDPVTGFVNVTGVLEGANATGNPATTLHVIAGGGTGIELFRRLGLHGYRVTTGVLNRMDSDAEAAKALGVEAVFEHPFAAVSDDAAKKARLLALGADGVVVSDVPFGPGNLVNLSIAEAALDAGRPVWIAEGVGGRDYTGGREATALAERLFSRGARRWESVQELMTDIKQTIHDRV